MTPRIAKITPVADEYLRRLVREELASLGGALLSTHGPDSAHPNETLATTGGFLLEFYSHRATVAYRDPPPPAAGEPPTTTPGNDA